MADNSNIVEVEIGSVSIIPAGEYLSTKQYERLSVVNYDGSAYIAKKANKGQLLTNEEYWFKLVNKGENGSSIENIEKTNTVGLVDTYTITLTDGSTQTFNVTNGKDGTTNLSVEYDTFSGALANIRNSAEAYMKSFNIEGGIEQKTREDLNVYNVNDVLSFGQEVSVDDDDWITVNYNNSEGSSIKFINVQTKVSSKIQPSTLYKIVVEVKSVSGNGKLIAVSNDNGESQFQVVNQYIFSNLQNNDIKITGATSKSDFSNSITMLRTYLRFEIGEIGSISFRLSAVKADEADFDTTTFKYQPYGAMPSIEFPSEVNGLGSETVNISVKNEDNSKNQTYPLNFGDLALYKDEIPYIEGDKVYYDKKWNKYVFTGNENMQLQRTRVLILVSENANIPIPISVNVDKIEDIYCNITTKASANNTWDGISGISYRLSDSPGFTICLENCKTEQEYRDALTGNYTVYQLATLVKTEITGELAEQIKDLYKSIHTYEGTTNIKLQGYGKINGEYLVNTDFATKLSEINDMTNIGLNAKINEFEKNLENQNPSIDMNAIKELIASTIIEDDNKKYPIGKLEFNVSGKNPSEYLGFGEWIAWGSGRVPVGFDANDTDFNKVEKTGGSKTATLEEENLPYHNHKYITITGVTGTTLTAAQCALREHSHSTAGVPSITGSTKLTAAQSGLKEHAHKLEKGYYTYNASGTVNEATGKGGEFISASNTSTTPAGGIDASEGHTHTITVQTIHTDTTAISVAEEEHTHELTSSTVDTFYDDAVNTDDAPYAFDIQQKYIVCYIWKRIS